LVSSCKKTALPPTLLHDCAGIVIYVGAIPAKEFYTRLLDYSPIYGTNRSSNQVTILSDSCIIFATFDWFKLNNALQRRSSLLMQERPLMKPPWHDVVRLPPRDVLQLKVGASAPLLDKGWMSRFYGWLCPHSSMQASHLTFPGPGFTVTMISAG
jgi:hypothetical protein